MTHAIRTRRTVALLLISLGIVTVSSLVTGCSSKQAMIVPNLSMAPTLQKNEKVVANFLAYKIEDPQRGDLAVFIPRDTENLSWVFRVAALPGDTLSYKDGVLQRNQETIFAPSPLEEQFFRSPNKVKEGAEMTFPYTLEENEYFFLSDDPSHMHDSRYWGPIDRNEIVGKLSRY